MPFEQLLLVPPANGPGFKWTTPVMLKHSEPSKRGLFVLIQVFDESALGPKTCIGALLEAVECLHGLNTNSVRVIVHLAIAGVPLQQAIDAPGISTTSWFPMNPVEGFADQVKGQLRVSVSFHPKARHGPTIHNLLEDMLADTQQNPNSQDVKPLATSSVSIFASRSKLKKGKLFNLPQEPVQHKIKARFTFVLRSFHLCSFHCSSLHGHSSSHTPDFSPVVRVTFGDFVHELHVDPRDCRSINFRQEWPVYSSFSDIEVEVLKPATVGGVCQKLIDGSSAMKICGMAFSCLGIPVIEASEWTLAPPRHVAGPGGQPPEKGFRWVSLHNEDEQCGLAEILTDYSEDYSVVLDTTEGPDVAFIAPDEREFDPSIVQRNIERLDELFFLFKSLQLWYAETLDWKYPMRTVTVWSSLTYLALHTPANRLPLYMLMAVAAFLSITFLRFRRGCVHRTWIEEKPGNSRRGPFRPAATLRFVPVCAKGLTPPLDSPTSRPNTFVRIFYEPNFKNISVQMIAQTECARQSASPVWAMPQPDTKSSEAFYAMNNRLMRDKVRSLSRYEQDTLVQDIVEPWPRSDGHVDTHAFRYRLLQPTQINARTDAEELVPWHLSPGAIRYDVMHDKGSNQSVLIGRGRVALKALVSDEKTGGPQLEQEIVLPLAAPMRNSVGSLAEVAPLDSESSTATIVARMQLVLRDPASRITLTESVESEALYSIVEMEHEKELSLVGKYHKAKDVAKNIQQTLGQLCSTAERFKNFLLWVHPTKTLLLFILVVLGCLWLWLIPVKYLVVFSLAKRVGHYFGAIEHVVDAVCGLSLSILCDSSLRSSTTWSTPT